MFESTTRNTRPLEQPPLDYSVCIQFLFMHLACLLVIWTGVSAVAVAVCVGLYIVRMFAITAGFHRLFAHRTYKTGRIFRSLMAFTGTAAYQKGPLWWSAHHRRHHLYADTDEDLHSPLSRTLWRSHVGWFLSRESQATDWKLITNLSKYPDLRFLDRFYSLPPALLALSMFLLGALLQRYAPGLGTSGWQMLVWGFFISTVVLYHGTFTVNSLAHVFGKRRFPTGDNSRNNLFVALITLGEGWHNNHHYYPSSERQGFYWWEFDMSHYILRALSWLGIVWDLRSPPANLFDRHTTGAHLGIGAPLGESVAPESAKLL
ncbi:MAG TPA: acyl-CoA desaturase [Blastocatellia bacterium]|nr:acyl-CoA desaturase [Blastocatellia bacterium]